MALTHTDKIAQGKAMMRVVRQLEAMGFKVRRGPWPSTLAAEARWDFAYHRRMLVPMNDRAGEAASKLVPHVTPEELKPSPY
jgi:hypothetical protein